MNKSLSFDLLRMTEAAALATAPLIGKGDKNKVDQVAVDAIRNVFSTVKTKGKVVIGEGKKDKAPMLYTGEELGNSKILELDIAVDPVEGTSLVASNRANGLSVMAITPKGNLFGAPDMYMKKIAVGSEAKGVIDLMATPTENIKAIAKAKDKKISDITVVILDRPRHKEIIKEIREIGARVKLIQEGDIVAAISTAVDFLEVDVLMGIGGAPEGVLAAAALKCLGGDMQAQLYPYNEEDIEEASQMGVKNINKILNIDDLVKGDEILCSLTGITDGELFKGVELLEDRAITHSILMSSEFQSVREIKLEHKYISRFKELKTIVNF